MAYCLNQAKFLHDKIMTYYYQPFWVDLKEIHQNEILMEMKVISHTNLHQEMMHVKEKSCQPSLNELTLSVLNNFQET